IGSGLVLFVIVIVADLIARYLYEYARKKGSNRADLEDRAKITREEEQVRHQFAEVLALLKASLDVRGQLRMAAAETRLAKHQEAYALWIELFTMTPPEAHTKAVMNCQRWWNENCLYLDADPRRLFRQAFFSSARLAQLRGMNDGAAVQAAWDDLLEA